MEVATLREQQQEMEEEIGDLFFAVVNLSRHLGVNPDVALQRANRKFEYRFRQVEIMIHKEGKEWSDYGLQELEVLWDKAKNFTVSTKRPKKACDSSLQ